MSSDHKAYIEFITGPMFAGKTQSLISFVKKAKSQGKNVIVFKPSVDIRYARDHVVSHSNESVAAVEIDDPKEILNSSKGYDCIAIDEVQLFANGLYDVIEQLSHCSIHILCAGLNKDYKAQLIPVSEQIMSLSNNTTILQSKCEVCGQPADYTFRKMNSNTKLLVGGSELYEPRCLTCYDQQ